MTRPHPLPALAVIDGWLGLLTRQSGLPGVQAAIRRKGKVIYSAAHGIARLDTGEKYTTRHLARMASNSKMLAAAATLLLSKYGVVALDEPAALYLPWLKKHRDRRARDITLRDLVTNRAGIFRDGIDADFWQLRRPFLSPAQVEAEVMQTQLVYEPNTQTKYSNIGFGLLGMALEAATGASYDEIIRTLIIDKIDAGPMLTDYAPVRGLRFAYGHSRRVYDDKRKTYKHTAANALAPAGGLCASAETMTGFLHTLLHTNKILPRDVQREMLSLRWPVMNSDSESYGLGLQFSQFQKQLFIGHSGGYPGFVSQTRWLAGSDDIFGLAVNTNEIVSLAILRGMADIMGLIDKNFTPAEQRTLAVSPPLGHNWGFSIFAVGKHKTLAFNVSTFSPGDDCAVYHKGRGGAWLSDTLVGYANPGEALRFTGGKRITGAKSGAMTLLTEAAFAKNKTKGFA